MLFLTEPLYVPRVWGSIPRRDGDLPAGEIWWVFHRGDDSAVLKDPSGSERTTVERLVSSGRLPGGSSYPVLLKTLHTADRLSVQVHPGATGGDLRKEETWIVLSAEPGAWMMGGLKGTDRDAFLRAVKEGRAEECLRRVPLEEGDAYHIPPGTVHALGPGLTVLEVQSNCDVTYRLYDWDRRDRGGGRRELHLKKGMNAVDWDSPGNPVPLSGDGIFRGGKLNADYSISHVSQNDTLRLPGGCIFFLCSGWALPGSELQAPACLLADSGGGSFQLGGSGYLIEP
ncbi:MAG: type I phosphomannose isomerase catalytic subunit [Candidatus Aegiribacteria sp.]